MLEGNNNSKSTTSPPNTDTHNDHQIVRIETSEEASDEPVHHHQHNNNNETTLSSSSEETTTRCCVNQEEKATQTSSSSRSSPPSTTSSPQQSLLTIQVASSNKSVSETTTTTTTTTTTQSLHTTSNTYHHHNFSNHHHHSSAIQQPSCSEISTSSSTIIDPYIPISSSKSHLYKPMIDVCLRNTALDLSKFTSPRFDYKIIKKLGGGIEGQVFLATLNDSSSINFNTSTPPQYAIKRITISTLPDLEQQIKLILQVCNVERESMAMMVMSSHNHHHHHQQHQQHSNHSLDSSSSHKFQHSSISSQVHIVPHYDIYYKEYKNSMRGECEYVLSIVMAFCDLGSLEDVIFNYATEYSKSSSPFISGELKLDWMINITRSLVFFHKRKLVHLDIKPDNILLQTKNSMLNQSPPPTYLQILEHANIYVSDFGLTREFRVGDSPLMSITGSKNYMAPEIFDGKYYNESVDMWALGIVALQLLVQKRRSRFDSLRNLLFNCSNNYETKLVIDNFISECVKEDESAIRSQDGGESSVSVSLKEPPITNNTTASHVNSGSSSSNNINGGSNNNLVTCPSNNYSQQDQYKLLTLLLDKGHNILLRMVYQCLRLDSSERLNATECLAFLTKEKREHFSMNHFHALQSSMTGGGQKKEMVDLLSTLDSIQQQINDSIDVIHIGNTHASLPNHITSSAGNSSSLLMGGYELFSPQLYVDSTFSPRMFITTNSSFTHSFAGSSHGGFGSFSSSALSPSLHNFMINTNNNNNNNGGGNSTSHSSGTTSMISPATAHRFNNSHFIIFKLARHFWDQMFGPYISKISWNEFKDCYYFFTKSALHSRSEKVLKCLLCDVDNYVYIHTFTKCVQNCKHFPFRDVYFSNLYVYSNIFSNNDHFMNPSSNNSESSDDSEDDEDDPTTFILKGGLRKQQQQQQQTFNSGGGVASGGNSSTTMNSMLYELFKRVQDEDNLVFTLKGKFDYIRFLKEVKIELVSYVKANPNILNIRDRSTNRENGSSGHASSTNHATKIHSGAGTIPSTTNDYTGKGNSPLSGGGGHSSTGTSTGSGTSSGGHSSNHMKTSQQYQHPQHSQQQPTMSGGSPSASLSNIMMSSMKSPQQHHHHTLSKHNSSSPNRSFSSSSSSSTSSHHQYSQSMSSIFHGANSPYLSHAPLFSNVNVLSMDMNDDFYNQQMRTRKRAAVIGVRNTNFDILFQSGDYESNGNNKNGGTGTGSRPKNHTLSMASTNSNSNLNSSTMAAAAHASISSLTNRFSTNSVNSNVTNTTTDFFYNKYSTTPITYVLNCRNCNFTDVDLSFFVSSIQRYYMEHIYTVSDQHSTSSSNILQLLASHNVSTVQTGSVTKIPLLISMRNILNMNYMEDFTDKMIQGCFEYYFGTAIKTSNNTDSAINIVSPLVGDAPQVSMGSFSDPMSVSSSFIPGTPTSPRGFTIPSNKSSHMLHSTSTMNGFSSKSHLQFNKDIQQYLRQQILNGNCILIFDHFQHFKGQDYYNILSQLSAFTNNTIYIVENQSQPTMMDDMSHPLDPNFNTFYSHYILKNIDIHSCGVNNISSLLQNCTAVNHASGQNILLTSTTLSDLSLFNNTTPTNATVNSSSVHSGAMNDASSSKKTNSLRGKNNLLPSQDLQNSKKKSFGGFLANTLFNEFNEFDFRYLEIARIPSFSYYFALKQSHEEYGGEIPIRMIIEQFLNKYYLSSDLSLMPLNTSHTISNNNNNSSSSSTTASLAIHRTSSGGSIGGGTSHSFGTTTWQHASTPDTAQRSSRDGSSDSLNPSSNMIPPYLAIDSTLSPQEGTNSDSTTTSKRTRSRSLRFSMGISNSNNTNNTNNTNNNNTNNANTNNNSTMHTHHGLGGGKRDSKNFISNFFHPSQPPSHSGNNTSGLNSPSNQLRLSLKDHYDDRKRISFNNIEQFTKNEKLLTVNDLIEFILDLAEYLSISKIEKFRKLPEDFFDGKPQLYRLIWKQIMFIYQMYYEDDHQISSQQFPLLGYLPQFKYFIMPTVVREYLTGVQWAKKEKHSLIRYLKRKTLKTVFKPKLTIRTSVIRKFYLDPFYRKCIYNMVHFMDKDEVKALLNKLQKDKLVLSEQVIIERILIRNLSIDKLEQFSNQVRRSSGMDLSGRTRASINPSNPTMMAATSLGAVHGSSNSSSSNISNVLGNTTAGMRSSWFGGNYESAHQSSSFISGIHTNTTNTTSMSQSLGDSFYVEDYIKDIGLIENLYREYLKRAITSKYVAIQNIALRILTSSTNDLNANTFIDVLSDFLKRNEPSDQSEDSQPIIFTTMEKKKSIFNSRKPTTSFRLSQPSSSPSSFQQDNDFFSVQNFNISNVVHSSGCIERLIEYCQENYLFEQMTTLLMNIYGTTPYLLLIVLSSPTIDVVLNRQVLNVYMHLLKKCVSDLLILINLSSERTQGNSQSHHQRYATSIGGNFSMSSSSSSTGNNHESGSSSTNHSFYGSMMNRSQQHQHQQQTNTTTNGIADVSFFILFKLILVLIRRIQMISPDEFISPSLESKSSYDSYKIVYPLYNNLFKHYSNIAHRSSKITLKCVDFLLALLGNNIVLDSDMCEKVTDDFKQIINYNFNGKIVHSLEYNVKFYDHVTKFVEVFEQDESYMNKLISLFVPHSINNMQVKDPIYGIDSLIAQSLLNLNNEGGGFLKLISCMQKNKEIILLMIMERILLNHYQFLKNTYSSRSNQVHSPTSENETSMSEYYDLYYQGILKKDYISIKRNHIIPRFIQLSKSVLILLANIESESKHGEEPSSDEEGDNDDEDDEEEEEEDDNSPSSIKKNHDSSTEIHTNQPHSPHTKSSPRTPKTRRIRKHEEGVDSCAHHDTSSSTDDSSSSSSTDDSHSSDEEDERDSSQTTTATPPPHMNRHNSNLLLMSQQRFLSLDTASDKIIHIIRVCIRSLLPNMLDGHSRHQNSSTALGGGVASIPSNIESYYFDSFNLEQHLSCLYIVSHLLPIYGNHTITCKGVPLIIERIFCDLLSILFKSLIRISQQQHPTEFKQSILLLIYRYYLKIIKIYMMNYRYYQRDKQLDASRQFGHYQNLHAHQQSMLNNLSMLLLLFIHDDNRNSYEINNNLITKTFKVLSLLPISSERVIKRFMDIIQNSSEPFIIRFYATFYLNEIFRKDQNLSNVNALTLYSNTETEKQLMEGISSFILNSNTEKLLNHIFHLIKYGTNQQQKEAFEQVISKRLIATTSQSFHVGSAHGKKTFTTSSNVGSDLWLGHLIYPNNSNHHGMNLSGHGMNTPTSHSPGMNTPTGHSSTNTTNHHHYGFHTTTGSNVRASTSFTSHTRNNSSNHSTPLSQQSQQSSTSHNKRKSTGSVFISNMFGNISGASSLIEDSLNFGYSNMTTHIHYLPPQIMMSLNGTQSSCMEHSIVRLGLETISSRFNVLNDITALQNQWNMTFSNLSSTSSLIQSTTNHSNGTISSLSFNSVAAEEIVKGMRTFVDLMQHEHLKPFIIEQLFDIIRQCRELLICIKMDDEMIRKLKMYCPVEYFFMAHELYHV